MGFHIARSVGLAIGGAIVAALGAAAAFGGNAYDLAEPMTDPNRSA